MGTFVLSKTKSGQFMFNLKAGNGQTILTSEQYTSKAAAKNGIASVQKNSRDSKRYEIRESKKGDPYFVLKAGNGQVIGQSEMYKSSGACDNGIASVKKNGPKGKVKDES